MGESEAPLAAAGELYNLWLRAGVENRFGPEGLLDHAAVQFHGHAPGVQLQLPEQARKGLTVRGGLGLAGRFRLTPAFPTGTIQTVATRTP